ncbi:MAG: lytic transglycosylase domain-containing protein [Mitsuaria chitosanitabida]|uniref:lytic transglycosylase domain-containing protein n=1 Tax=Roseateles chitosanitabidus TaxID=65048 RepID=UPI001B02C745|nr:lytic transglycosylase domain-containing protein [Roseateles chitosanitabidus]MBO9687004.1 lytic transglycosylase domain-containing protein [Roseateles chitosanitabidus]
MKFARITVTALASATVTALAAVATLAPLAAHAQSPSSFTVVPNPPPPLPDLVTDAREAWRVRDRAKLSAMRQAAFDQQHPLAPWFDYWNLNARLSEAQQAEINAFYARWPGSYVEDRLRNDWLLELGHRRDWANFRRDLAGYKMQDDREVVCYTLLADPPKRELRDSARAAWFAQRDADEGCNMLAATLHENGVFKDADVWRKLRLVVETNKPRAVKQTSALLSKADQDAIAELMDKPDRYLKRKAAASPRAKAELTLLALMRLAATDYDKADDDVKRWAPKLPNDLSAWLWAQYGRQAALRLKDEASDHFARAIQLQAKAREPIEWSDDTVTWIARAALRADNGAGRPAQLAAAIELMKPSDQKDIVWQYWRAKAQQQLAEKGPAGDAQRREAQESLRAIASPLSFYGKLAADELKLRLPLPPTPAELSAQERAAVQQQAGIQRALQLLAVGLRGEGQREWNFSLRGLSDRELLAVAQTACERELWERCIQTSERTRGEIDLAQRFPMPYRADVLRQATAAGLDPAYVYGLIRQESRFMMDARSHVGAGGLMQVMPATAKWTAKKLGVDFRPDMLHDRDTNLRLGTGYLKLVMDSFDGSQAMAAAAYNAGPGRPRRWREGPQLDAAIWTENIPIWETRDYVRKVLSNATIYAQLMGREGGTLLRDRLGRVIGPAAASQPDIPANGN